MKKYNKILILLLSSLFIGCDSTQITNSPSVDTPISNPISEPISGEYTYSNNDKYSDNKYSEDQKVNQLIVPVFHITQEGRVMLDPHNHTNRFMLSINGVEQEIFFGQDIYLSFGDEVKIKALSEDTDLYTDSEYSEIKVFNTVLLPKLFLNYNNYDEVFELSFNEMGDYESIYLKVNETIKETTLSEFLNMHFEVGDEVSIKYKSLDENYIESVWSDPIIVPERYIWPKLSAPILASIPNQPLNVELFSHIEVSILLEVNGVVEELPYTKEIDRQFNTGDVIRVKYKSLNEYVEDSDWSNEIVYHNTYELKFTKENNPLNNISINEDGSKTFEVVASDGNKYKFILNGEIKPSDEGIGIITPGSSLTCLSKIDGLYGYQGNVESHSVSAQLSFGIDPANIDVLDSERQITWMSITDVQIPYTEIDIENHFKINNPWQEEYVLPEFTIYFTGVETIIEDIRWNEDFFRPYIKGESYDQVRETDPLDYYIIMDAYNPYTNKRGEVYYTTNYTVNALKDKNDNILDKNSRIIQEGDKVAVTVGDFTKELDITIESMKDVYTQYDSQKYSYAKAKGNLNAIVIPICLSDQKDRANDQNLNAIYKALGKVIDKNGNVTSYIDETDEAFSLSEYYEKTSFGQLFINSFVTDWYHIDISSNESSRTWDGQEEEIVEWFKQTYSDMDMSQFDQDQNGLFDEIIFINTNDFSNKDFYNRTGIDGAFRYSYSYTNNRAKTLSSPGFNSYINISLGFLFDDMKIDDGITGFTSSTLIHEFGHTLGLVDYYDTNGIFSALGSYDMQDSNAGDWNIYSKYSVGWINPFVIDEDVFNGSDTYTIKLSSASLNGDALLIPTRGYDYNGTPFDEYIMVEFFTPDGLHEYDSKDFGLENTYGVRIYHVNSIYEKRTLDNDDGTTVDIGTIHYSNSTSNSSINYGKFLIELIQANGRNTLTVPNVYPTILNSNDFFYEGDVFDVSNYTEFFYNGLMDNGMEFGYTITIDEINSSSEEPYAVITINKK